jgi:hypothetical protein
VLLLPFKYQDNLQQARFGPLTKGVYDRYVVHWGDDADFTIATSGIKAKDGKIFYVQLDKPGEILQPHDLVQAMGDGIENAIYQKIDEIFFGDWNPIGNPDIPPNEYSSYVPGIFQLLRFGSDMETIANRLHEIECGTMGLPGSMEHCRDAAWLLLGILG